MTSLLGPQWLCQCDKRGGAETVEKAAVEAAQHFLSHGTAGEFPYSVSVYKKRNDWAYTISTQGQAIDVAYPLQEVKASTIAGPYTHTLAPTLSFYGQLTDQAGHATEATTRFTNAWKAGDPIELGSLTIEEASARFSATIDSMLASRVRGSFSMPSAITGI